MLALVAAAAGSLFLLNQDYTTPAPVRESFETHDYKQKTGEYTAHCWKVTAGVAIIYMTLSINGSI